MPMAGHGHAVRSGDLLPCLRAGLSVQLGFRIWPTWLYSGLQGFGSERVGAGRFTKGALVGEN